MVLTLQQVWSWRKLITVEPLMFCYIMPALFLYVANENFPLEKSCRVNLGLDPQICNAMMKKSDYDIVCADDDTIAANLTEIPMTTQTFSVNGTEMSFFEFQDLVCQTERDSQTLIASYNGIRSILSSFFSFIVVIFAGGWSDKKKLRKPLMLFALIGEFLGSFASVISAIFWDEIPMQFTRVVGYVVPYMFGGFSMMLMGCYAYLTCITKEEDRTARFGMFAIYVTVLGTIGAPFSGELLNALGYTNIFILATVFYILGILQIVFILEEEVAEPSLPPAVSSKKAGTDNPAFDNIELQTQSSPPVPPPTVEDKTDTNTVERNKVKTFLVEFFDPTLVMDAVKVLLEKHKNYGQIILYLCLLNLFLFIGANAEAEYVNGIARIKFGWEGPELGRFYSFSTFSALIGTAIMTNFMTKFFNVSDGMIGIVGAAGSIVSRLLFATAGKELLFWIAQAADLFITTKGLSVRSILSKTFDENNLGKVFSLMAIIDTLIGFVFPPLYAEVYQHTISTAPETVFYFSQLFLVPSLILFVVCYYIFQYKRKKPDEAGQVEAQEPDVTAL